MKQEPILIKELKTNLPNGRELTITGTVFENPINERGEPKCHNQVEIKYTDTGKKRWVGFYEIPMEEKELENKIANIVENIDSYNNEQNEN